MSLRFDAAVKELAQTGPRGFLAEFDAVPSLPVSVLNVDLSTVTAATDVVFGLGDPLQEVVHIDFQSGPAEGKHRDLLAYSALLHRLYRVPVHTIVVLLRPEARHRNLDGKVRYESRPGRGKMDFGYEVVELWRRPAEQLLKGDLATVPLAPLGQLPAGLSLQEGLADVIRRLVERLEREATPELAHKLLTAAFVLTGLRVDKDTVRQLFQGVQAMRESSAYQLILEEGAAEGAQKILLGLGRKRFGQPDEATRAAVVAITDFARLEQLVERVYDTSSWEELLQTP
jgi:hypothetical protein